MTHETGFDLWLAEATRGLPESAADKARVELSAHYLDARDDLLERGTSPAEAGPLALAGLGSARDVATGLLDTHVGRWHYRVAVWLCAWNLLMIPVIAFATVSQIPPGMMFIALFALFFPTMMVIDSTRMVLEWRLRIPYARPMMVLLMAGAGVETVSMMLMAALPADGGLRLGIHIAALAGFTLTGGCLIWLVIAATQSGKKLGYLRAPLVLTCWVLAFAQIALGNGIPLTMEAATHMGFIAALAGHVLLWPVLMLLFYRIGYRRDIEPMLAA